MEVISSRATCFHKKAFAVVWFGFLSLAAGSLLWDRLRGIGDASATDFLFIGFLAFLGLGIMSALVFDLADEVVDAGDYLVVRKGRQEERVELSEIVSVNYVRFVNPARVTLRLARPGALGKEIAFIPAQELGNLLGAKSIAAELMERVHAARARRAVKVGP